MRNSSGMSLIRTALAGICSLALCATLAACGGSNGKASDDGSAKGGSSSDVVKEATKDLTQMAGVTATGTPGQKPTISVPKGMTVKNRSYAVLQKGNGKTISLDDRVCAQGIIIGAKTGTETGSTWEKNTPDCSIVLSRQNIQQVPLLGTMVGQKVNATIAYGNNDQNSQGTSYILVYTLVSATKDPKRATGEKVTDIPADLPKVTLGKGGKPSIDMNGQKSVDKLVVQPLIKGTGAKLTDQDTAVVKYTGWLTDGTQFDSSWDRDATFDADLSASGQIIQGWKDGLIGQTVGSQVMLIIPPDLGYGDQDSGSIPANSTLVFVVDILAAY